MTRPLPKPSRRAATLFNLAFSNLAVVMVIVQGIVLVPLYVSRIQVALYGAWLATGNVLMWIDLVDPGISDILRQRVGVAHGRNDAPALARTIGTGVALGILDGMLPLLLWPLGSHLAGFVHLRSGGDVLAHSFHLGLIGTSLMLSTYAVAAVNLGLQLTFPAGVVLTSSSVIGLGVTVALLLAGVGLPSLPYGMLARGAVLFLGNAAIAIAWCRRHLDVRPSVSVDELKSVLKLTAYTFVSRLGTTLLDRADAMLSARILSPDATVTLVLTGRAFEPIRGVAASLPSALMGGISHLTGEGDMKRVGDIAVLVVRVAAWAAALGASAVVALNADFMRLWLHRPIYGGVALTAALGAAMCLTVLSAALTRLIYAVGGIQQSSGASLAEALIKLPLQIGLMRAFGLIGMPVASIIATTLVTGWVLPRVAARLFHQRPAVQHRLWVENVARLAVMIGLGLAGRALLARFPLARTWPSFVATAAVVGALLVGFALAVDPTLREGIRSVRRARAAASTAAAAAAAS